MIRCGLPTESAPRRVVSASTWLRGVGGSAARPRRRILSAGTTASPAVEECGCCPATRRRLSTWLYAPSLRSAS
jgi:hypothetical protein